MAHLHIPDGVLPLWLWLPAWGVAIAVLGLTWRAQGARPPQRIAYEGALGALMLAAMALELPLGPVEYHLTLAAPIGVLLGPVGAFQAAFIASAVLAFMGHGGLTLIGLNALLLGVASTIAPLLHRAIARSHPGAGALAGAAAAAHLASGAAWFVLVLAAARWRQEALGVAGGARLAVLAGVALPLVLFGVVAETAAAWGMGHFLVRVRPDLLPGFVPPDPAASAPGARLAGDPRR
jgi:cobalt/nickel transport system permease protein